MSSNKTRSEKKMKGSPKKKTEFAPTKIQYWSFGGHFFSSISNMVTNQKVSRK